MHFIVAEKHEGLILESLCAIQFGLAGYSYRQLLYTFTMTECMHKARRLWNSAQNEVAAQKWVFQNWLAEDLGCSFRFCDHHPRPLYHL